MSMLNYIVLNVKKLKKISINNYHNYQIFFFMNYQISYLDYAKFPINCMSYQLVYNIVKIAPKHLLSR